MSGVYGAEKTDCDSPFGLMNSTLEWIGANLKDSIDFVVWTGDSARHDSDENFPRHEKSVLNSNRAVADKITETFSTDRGELAIPVIPTFGNNDFLPHNIMTAGPNKWFHEYSDIWKRFIPEEQRHSFEFGGWFYVEVIPNKLAVFSLNTMFFFDRNAAVDGCASPSEPGYKHMEWLRVQLERMREMGMKAILMGHVPPARTDSKQNWDETCWQRYTLWLQKYRDVVTASLYGHMNIDHFLLADTKEIKIDSESVEVSDVKTRGDMSTQSKGDYLQELRDLWSDLPKSASRIRDEEGNANFDTTKKKKKKQGKKYRKIGGKYAERYQLSFINPSVVPNYFPTIRVFEYNITGLENADLWVDAYHALERTISEVVPNVETVESGESLELRSVSTEKKKKGKKGRKGKKGKGKPKDPNLIIPNDPPKSSLPGPAYFPQTLTLTGYTQYFANLTYINNDYDAAINSGSESESAAHNSKWRGGNPDQDKPKHHPAKPREFKYEVEYTTFDDKLYKFKDLTVRNYLDLAYRMGQQAGGKSVDAQDDFDDDYEDEDMSEDEQDESVEANEKVKNKKKKHNKAWLRFLDHAFVKTVPKDELKDM